MENRVIDCIAKENYIHYQQCVQENLYKLQNKKTVIFGAGIIGMQFSYILEMNKITSYLFCDNDSTKWGNKINNQDIISPEELDDKRDSYFVCLAMENYTECAKQLEEKGYCLGQNWIIIHNYSGNKLIHDFCDMRKEKVLVLGDCITSNVSILENKKNSLAELLMENEEVRVLGMNGLYMREFYMLLQMALSKNPFIKKVILMLDISILYEKYHLLPKNQHKDVMECLGNKLEYATEEMNEFFKEIDLRGGKNGDSYLVSPKRVGNVSKEEIENGRKLYMRINQMFTAREDTESVTYLEKILDICNEKEIEASVIVCPVNYELGEEYFHELFFERYGAICEMVECKVKRKKANYLDLSYLLPRSNFITIRSASEGIKEDGRRKMVKEIEKII